MSEFITEMKNHKWITNYTSWNRNHNI